MPLRKHYWLFVLAAFVLQVDSAKRKAQGKVKYELNWLSGFESCEEYENDKIDPSDIKITKISTSHTGLTGDMVVMEEIPGGTEIEVIIEKETQAGKEFMFLLEDDFCSHLSDEDMPWASIVDALGLDPKDCPIAAKSYSMGDCKLNMAFANKVLSHDFVGQYVAKVTMKHSGEGLDLAPHTIACFRLGVSVDETREEAEGDEEN